tara:strand:+ start:540 stop:1139 length:600 start_codon:yes stop_codon:yes gene_type:complete
MNFISIDAVSEKANISLFLNNESVLKYTDCKNSSYIPKAINSCLSKTNTEIDQLDFIAVTIGPGSYTGIRVAISIAQGIAYSLSIPLVPINTMNYIHSQIDEKNNDDVVGFPTYGENLFYFKVKDGPNRVSSFKNISHFKDKKVFGVQLEKYSDIIDYQKVDFCSKSIGLYAFKNYEDLKTLDLNVVSPVYLDNFMLKK